MIPPTVLQACTDRRLRGGAYQLLVWLATHQLDVEEWRPCKQEAIAFAMRVHKARVSEWIGRLVSTGYLERRRTADGAEYRLPLTRRRENRTTEALPA